MDGQSAESKIMPQMQALPIIASPHLAVHKAVRDGLIARKPCEVCGNKRVVAHHDDYTKPLELRWLCHSHHALEHVRMKQNGITAIGRELVRWPNNNHKQNFRPTSSDWELIAALRTKLGLEFANIVRLAIRTLAQKEGVEQ